MSMLENVQPSTFLDLFPIKLLTCELFPHPNVKEKGITMVILNEVSWVNYLLHPINVPMISEL